MRLRTARLILALAVAAFSAVGSARAAPAPPPPKTAQPQFDEPAPPTPSEIRAELYARLAASKDADETEGIIDLLMAAYAQSGSDTGDLLLERAHKAVAAKDYKAAGKILDETIAFLPGCAEAWNGRATLRYLEGDTDGSMADIAETLKREPRHLGALLGLASILESRDKDDEALKVYERVLAIAPHWKSAEEAEARLKAKIAGLSL
jgi:tetratricopeptide (TPR) repeat protein